MSGEDERRLYALMAAAEDTQKAAAAAVEALGAKSAAFAQQVEVVRTLTVGLDEALRRIEGAGATFEGAGASVGATAASAVRDTVARTMQAEAARRDEAAARATHGAIVAAVGQQAATLQATTERTVATARAVEGRLQRAAAGLGWRWMAMAAAGMVAGVVATVGVGYGVGWWQGERIEAQRATIERLTPEVERLGRLADELDHLAEASEAFIFGSCGGESDVLCVRVNERRRATNDDDAPEGSAVFVVWGGEPSR